MPRTVFAVVVALVLASTTLGAQETTDTSDVGYKSPRTARLFGIFPGAGHFYADEPGRGLAYLAGTGGILLLCGVAAGLDCLSTYEEDCGESDLDFATALAFGIWGFSIYDAGRAAHRATAWGRVAVPLVGAPGSAAPTQRGTERRLKIGISLRARPRCPSAESCGLAGAAQ
jgi:TM2 domain-containing membrane protein YozV